MPDSATYGGEVVVPRRDYTVSEGAAGTVGEQFKAFANDWMKNPSRSIPFVGGAVDLADMAELLAIANRARDGTATDDELATLQSWADAQAQERGTVYQILDMVSTMPAFMGELVATGGIATGVRTTSKRALLGALRSTIGRNVRDIAKKRGASAIATKAASEVGDRAARLVAGATAATAGAVARAPVARATEIAAGTARNLLPVEVERTADDEAIYRIAEEDPDFVTALAKAFGSEVIEVWSEATGGAFTVLGRAALPMLTKVGIVRSLQKLNPAKKPKQILEFADRVGYHGILQEMGEERVGEAVRAAAGIDEWRLPTGEQLLVELAAFAVPAAAFTATSAAMVKDARVGYGRSQEELVPGGMPPLDANEKRLAAMEAAVAQVPGQKIEIPDGAQFQFGADGQDLEVLRIRLEAVGITPSNVEKLIEAAKASPVAAQKANDLAARLEARTNEDAEATKPVPRGKGRAYDILEAAGVPADWLVRTPRDDVRGLLKVQRLWEQQSMAYFDAAREIAERTGMQHDPETGRFTIEETEATAPAKVRSRTGMQPGDVLTVDGQDAEYIGRGVARIVSTGERVRVPEESRIGDAVVVDGREAEVVDEGEKPDMWRVRFRDNGTEREVRFSAMTPSPPEVSTPERPTGRPVEPKEAPEAAKAATPIPTSEVGPPRAARVGAEKTRERISGTRAVAQRMANAESAFIESVQEQFGYSAEEARTILDRYQAAKLITLDPVSGGFNLKDGRAWERETMERALGREPEVAEAQQEEPEEPGVPETGAIAETAELVKKGAVQPRRYRHFATKAGAEALRRGEPFAPPSGEKNSYSEDRLIGRQEPEAWYPNGTVFGSLDDGFWMKRRVRKGKAEPKSMRNLPDKEADRLFNDPSTLAYYDYDKQDYVYEEGVLDDEELVPVDVDVAPDARILEVGDLQGYRRLIQAAGGRTEFDRPEFWERVRKAYDVVEVRNSRELGQRDGPRRQEVGSAWRFWDQMTNDQVVILNPGVIQKMTPPTVIETSPAESDLPRDAELAQVSGVPAGSPSPQEGAVETRLARGVVQRQEIRRGDPHVVPPAVIEIRARKDGRFNVHQILGAGEQDPGDTLVGTHDTIAEAQKQFDRLVRRHTPRPVQQEEPEERGAPETGAAETIEEPTSDAEAPLATEGREAAPSKDRRIPKVPKRLTPSAIVRRMGGLNARVIERIQKDLPQESGKAGAATRRKLKSLGGGQQDVEVFLQDAMEIPEYEAVLRAAGIGSHDDFVNAFRTGRLFETFDTSPEDAERPARPINREELESQVRAEVEPERLLDLHSTIEAAHRDKLIEYEDLQDLSQLVRRQIRSLSQPVPFEEQAPYDATAGETEDEDTAFKAHIAGLRADWERDQAEARESIGPDGGALQVGERDRYVVSRNPDKSEPDYPWRVTHFILENDTWIPAGHTLHKTLDDPESVGPYHTGALQEVASVYRAKEERLRPVVFEPQADYAGMFSGEKRVLPRGPKSTKNTKRLEGTPLLEAQEERKADAERRAAPQMDLFGGVATGNRGTFDAEDPSAVHEEAASYGATQPWQLSPDQLADKKEFRDALQANYFNESGEQIASSRDVPAETPDVEDGTWVVTWTGSHGREIEQLRTLDPNSLEPTEPVEGKAWGRLDDVARYRDWIRAGRQPPPIEVVETESGKLRIVDGHRRWLAAKEEGRPIRAWVSPAIDLPGKTTPEGKPIKVGLTWELAVHQALRDGAAVPVEVRRKLPPLESLVREDVPTYGADSRQAAHAAARSLARKAVLTESDLVEIREAFRDSEALVVGEVGPVYHGSPHAFERFDSSKIGTGEGAQTFGHGIYFSSLADVARFYAPTKYTNMPQSATRVVELQMVAEATPDRKAAAVAEALASMDETIERLKKEREQSRNLVDQAVIAQDIRTYSIARDFLQTGQLPKLAPRHLYRATLHKGKPPDQYTWLDWFETITLEQEAKVDAQLRKDGVDEQAIADFWEDVRNRAIGAEGVGVKKNAGMVLYGTLKDVAPILYRARTGRNFWDDGGGSSKTMRGAEASSFLLRAGIDGVRYPTGTIGAGPGGTGGNNYVVFDDDAITIEDRAVFDKRPKYAKEQLDLFAPERLNEETRSIQTAGREKRTDTGGIRRLFKALKSDMQKIGYHEMRGKVVTSAHEVAKAFQVFSDRHVEALRLIVTDSEGEIVSHIAYTSREAGFVGDPAMEGAAKNPAAVNALIARNNQRLRRRLERLHRQHGPLKMWLLHNHPTGNPEPSYADRAFSSAFASSLGEMAGDRVDYQGHVIIDTDQFAWLAPGMEGSRVPVRYGIESGEVTDLEPAAPPELVGAALPKITDPHSVGQLGLLIKDEDRFAGIILRGGQEGRLMGIEAVPINFVMSDDFEGYIRNVRPAYGATEAFVYYGGGQIGRDEFFKRLDPLFRRGLLRDVIYNRQKAMEAKAAHGDVSGVEQWPVRVERAAEDVAPYDESPDASVERPHLGEDIFDDMPSDPASPEFGEWLDKFTQQVSVVPEVPRATKPAKKAGRRDGPSLPPGRPVGQSEDPPILPPSPPGEVPTHEDFFTLEVPEETRWQWFVRKTQNEINRLEQVERIVAEGRGVALKAVDKTSQAAEAFVGRAGHKIDRFRHAMLTGEGSFLRNLNDAGFTVQDLDWYLMAKHAPERNAHILAVNPKAGPAGSGLTDEQAAEILEGFGDDALRLDTFAQEVWANNRKALQARLESGLINQGTHDALSSRWQFYVPLKGKAGTTSFPNIGKGYSVRGQEFRKALGRHSLADSPFAQSLADYEESIIRAEKNRVMQAFYRLVEQNPSPGFWHIELPQDDITEEHIDRSGNIRAMREGTQVAKNVVVAKFDGKARYIVVEDEAMRNAMLRLGTGASLKAIGTVSQYMRLAATAYNPEFLVTNFERDLQTALANISAEEIKGIRRGIVKDLPWAMRGVWRNVREKGNSEAAELYDDLKASGGKVSWFDVQTVQEKQEELQKLVKAMDSTFDPRKVLHAVGNFVADANEAVESAVRLSTYRQLLKAGMPKERAALAVKNLTVNFNKKGEWGHAMNTLYLFSNASIQGSVRIIFNLRRSQAARTIAASMFAMSFLQSYINRLFDDDWEDVSAYDKDNYFIFPGGASFKLSYGWNLFHVLGNITEEAVNGDLTLGEASSRLLAAIDNSFNPLGGGSFSQFIAPSFLDPIVQWTENKNFFGGPVRPKQNQYGPKVPRSQLYFSSVRGTSKALTDWLFEATGGIPPAEYVNAKGETVKLPAVKGDWTVDVSPELIDHIIDSIGMGAGKFISNTVESIAALSRMELPDIRNVPIARQFVRAPSQWVPRELMHDILDEAGTTLMTPHDHERFYEAIERSLKRGALTKEQAERYSKAFRSSQDKLRERMALDGINPTTEQLLPEFARLTGQLQALRDLRRADQARAIVGEMTELEKEVGTNRAAFERALSTEQQRRYKEAITTAARQTKLTWRSEKERRGQRQSRMAPTRSRAEAIRR